MDQDKQAVLEAFRQYFGKTTHKPHMLCKDIQGDLWEFISYPYIEGEHLLVRVRIPGDPTSMITVHAVLMDAEYQSCFCTEAGKDFYLKPEYYLERHARLSSCPALAYKR